MRAASADDATPHLRRRHDRMERALLRLPWLLVGLAALFPLLVIGDVPGTGPIWRAAVVGAGLTAGLIGWRRHGLPALVAAATALSAARIAAFHTAGSPTGLDDLAYHHAIADLFVGLGLIVVLVVVLRTRRSEFRTRDAVDIVAVLAGGSLVGWLVIVEPLVHEHGIPIALAVLAGAYLPVTMLVSALVVDTLTSGLTQNRAMQLMVASALLDLAATTTEALQYSDVAGWLPYSVVQSAHVAGFLLFTAGLIHPDIAAAIQPPVARHDGRHTEQARLAIMVVSFSVPAVMVASLPGTGGADRAIRVVGTAVLMSIAALRLRIALRDDIAARQVLIDRLHRDELTGLPTRQPFVDRVAELLEETWRSDRHPTIIQLNIDRFKNINDSLGHADANHVLATVAERLASVASEFGDAAMAARSGGDAFTIVDGSTVSTAEAMDRVEAIRDRLAEPITVGETTIFVTASIGVAVAPRNRTLSAEELLRRADIATHAAKDDGRNQVAVFDDPMQAKLARRMDVEHALHGAVGRQEMVLYHQPIVDIVTGEVSGFEALMRWRRPDGTMVSPADFIPIAEETGMICELGTWAIRDALRSLRAWIDAGTVKPTTTMSVNVSPRQVADENFADLVAEAVASSGVPPHLLWLEMTESMMLEEPELATTTLREIRAKGIRLALDDFGTGYSSLSLLQQFPIQRIKIDRAFVQGISERTNDRSLVRTIIAMAQTMGFDLVAEGVETVQQLEALRDLGCHKAQGFLISRPVPADALSSTMVAMTALKDLQLFAAGQADTDRPVSAEPLGSTASMPVKPSAPIAMPTSGLPLGLVPPRPIGNPLG